MYIYIRVCELTWLVYESWHDSCMCDITSSWRSHSHSRVCIYTCMRVDMTRVCVTYHHNDIITLIHAYVYTRLCELTCLVYDSCICKCVRIHIHWKRGLHLPFGSLNLVLKLMRTPDKFHGAIWWNMISPGCPWNFNTKLTEPTRQIQTIFPMNMTRLAYVYVSSQDSCMSICEFT